MIFTCKFNPVTDEAQVVPGLDISIKMALATGVVKDTATSSVYTKETDVNAVGNYLTDAIEIALAAKALNKSLSNLPTSTTPSETLGE